MNSFLFRWTLFLVLAVVFLSCNRFVENGKVDELELAVGYDPIDLDPHRWGSGGSVAVNSHFYDGLVHVDGNFKVQPALAESWENPDLNTWVVRLRSGVSFHSGKKLSSKDVVYSFRRVLENPGLELAIYARNIKEVSAIDASTVIFRTHRPVSILLNKIRMVYIVPEGSSDQELANRADGTGPYRLVQWTRGERILMLRNERYWGSKSFVRKAELILASTPEEALEAIQEGRADFAQCNSRAALANQRKEGYQLLRSDGLFVYYLGFHSLSNSGSGELNPFASDRVRKAVHLGLDRESLISKLSIFAVPASQPVPVSVVGYNPQLLVQQPDRANARRLLQDAGWRPNQKAILYVRNSFLEAGQIIQNQLSEIGMVLQVVSLPDDRFFELRKQGNMVLYLSRFACTTGDASEILEDLLYSSDQSKSLTEEDHLRYMHPTIGADPNAPPMLHPLEHRKIQLQKVMTMLMEDVIQVPLYAEQDVYLMDSRYSWKPRYDGMVLVSEFTAKTGSE